MIRPIRDRILVRMEPPPEMTPGGLHIPEESRADVGTWRAQREAKIGTVLAVGPGRARLVRTGWERDRRKQGPLKPEEVARKWDFASEGAAVMPMGVKVGDRVLFDPKADLQQVDASDPLLRVSAEYQVAGLACATCGRFVCGCEEAGASVSSESGKAESTCGGYYGDEGSTY